MREKELSIAQAMRVLYPYIRDKDKLKIPLLVFVSFIAAITEMGVAGSVALLASFFGDPKSALEFIPASTLPFFTFLGDDIRFIIFMCMALVTLTISFKSVWNWLTAYLSANLSQNIAATIRSKILAFYSEAPYIWTLKNTTSNMLFSIGAAQNLGHLFITLTNLANHFLIFLIFIAGLLFVSFLSSVLLFACLGIGVFLLLLVLKPKIEKRAREAFNSRFRAHNIQLLGVNALKELKIYGREEVLQDKYDYAVMDEAQANVRSESLSRVPVLAVELLGFLVLLLILAVMIWGQNAGMARITGTMGLLAAAAWRLLPVVNRMLSYWSDSKKLAPFLYRSTEAILEKESMEKSLLERTKSPQKNFAFNECVAFEDLSFSYPGSEKNTLENISFKLPKGKMLGIVGLSGAGKSTLINLFTGLISPSKGKMIVDGQELTNENLRSWLKQVGYVAQSPYILDASLAENIGLSRWGEEIDYDRVEECCNLAALDFISELPDAFDTILGERGSRLSGGQAQRVVIARALYSNPQLVFFDEATSSLDIQNEKKVHETILTLKDKLTMVIVAHRLSAVEECDYILWLDKGTLKMYGETFEVLPEYRKFLGLHELS